MLHHIDFCNITFHQCFTKTTILIATRDNFCICITYGAAVFLRVISASLKIRYMLKLRSLQVKYFHDMLIDNDSMDPRNAETSSDS